jgi:hypothetical protein
MGLPGSGPVRTRLNLEQMLNDGVRPDVLLIEVLPPLLSEGWPGGEVAEDRVPRQSLRREELVLAERLARGSRADWSAESLAAQFVPGHTYRLSLVNATVPTLLSIDARDTFLAASDESGWAPFPPLTEEKIRNLARKAREEYLPSLQGFRLSEWKLGMVGETVDVARQNGMTVALVLMPEGPTFRSWYPPGAWEQIRAALAALGERHGVPLLDLREGRPEEDFVDSHHLTTEGARAFTRDLTARIEPLLRATAGDRERLVGAHR